MTLIQAKGGLRIATPLPLLVAVLLSVATVRAAGADTRLIDAVKNHDATAVRALLKQHADVKAVEVDGSTALLWAAHFGDADATDLLIAAGADVKAANRYGVTALYEAASAGDAVIVEKLLKAGADPNARLATTDGCKDYAPSCYPIPNPPVSTGKTPLIAASIAGNVPAVKMLLDRGADPSAGEGWQILTPLMHAAAANRPQVVKALLEAGANVNAVASISTLPYRGRRQGRFYVDHAEGGFTALMFAARQGDVESVQLMLKAGANVNFANPEGAGPLLLSILNGRYDTAALLMENGADPTDGSLYVAVDRRNTEGYGNTGDNSRPLEVFPNKLSSLDLIKLLLARGANPNAVFTKELHTLTANTVTSPAATAFYRAAANDDVAVMRLLLEKGANPRWAAYEHQDHSEYTRQVTSNFGLTPLMAAVRPGARRQRGDLVTDPVEAVKICLAAGSDVNAVDPKGNTALHIAAGRGLDTIVQVLADGGAKLNAKNGKGLTPLDVAQGKSATDGEDDDEAPKAPVPHLSTAALLLQLMGVSTEASTQKGQKQ